MNKITIVIPNYNGISYITPCLSSLYAQATDTPSFEILVVDNCSEDGSREVIEADFPEVRLISLSENTGFCHAVNVGIQQSESPFVLLLNNDTKVKPDFVKSLYDAICRDEKIFSVSAKMLMWDNPRLIDDAGDRYCVLGWAFARGKGKPAAKYDTPVEIFSACGGAVIYRRGILEEIGIFDEAHFAYLEDLDIGYRAKIYGYHNFYEPKAEVLHYGSASTGSRYNKWKTERAAANSIYVIAKNMPILQVLLNLPFLIIGFFIKFLFFCGKGMGILYLKGICNGFKQSFCDAGRRKRVPFAWKHLGNYCMIQWQLYVATFQFIMKS